MRRGRIVAIGLATAALFACWRSPQQRSSDFDADLARLEAAIFAADGIADLDPDAAIVQTRRALLLFDRATLTNNPAHLEEARAALATARQLADQAPLLREMELRLAFRLHRVPQAKKLLQEIGAASDAALLALNADIALAEGRYQDARAGYEGAIGAQVTWEHFAGLAQLKTIVGDWDEAHRLYALAEEQLTAREMRQFAWLELQRGALEFRRGRFDAARTHYTLADRAYSGYWLVQEHLAELEAAEGRFDTAIDLYLRVLIATARPEVQQALGDVYMLAGDAIQARQRYALALAGYLASVESGDVHYFHHLTGFHAEVSGESGEAVKWARRDLELRQGYEAHDALAWALYRDGRTADALDEIDRALASGAYDAHVYQHAATINFAAGRSDAGRHYLRLADDVNPRRERFHAHP